MAAGPAPPEARRHLKTYTLTAVVVCSNVLGNLVLTMGVRGNGGVSTQSPLAYIGVLLNPLVIAGVSLLILWMLSHMALLSAADLSYVLPVTSIGYVLSALTGWLFLSEQISPPRWAGILLIMCGVALVGRTAPRTT